MSSQLQRGAVVRLKSGGPAMTVTKVGQVYMSNDMSVWCTWFDAKGEPKEGTFPVEAVELDD